MRGPRHPHALGSRGRCGKRSAPRILCAADGAGSAKQDSRRASHAAADAVLLRGTDCAQFPGEASASPGELSWQSRFCLRTRTRKSSGVSIERGSRSNRHRETSRNGFGTAATRTCRTRNDTCAVVEHPKPLEPFTPERMRCGESPFPARGRRWCVHNSSRNINASPSLPRVETARRGDMTRTARSLR